MYIWMLEIYKLSTIRNVNLRKKTLRAAKHYVSEIPDWKLFTLISKLRYNKKYNFFLILIRQLHEILNSFKTIRTIFSL